MRKLVLFLHTLILVVVFNSNIALSQPSQKEEERVFFSSSLFLYFLRENSKISVSLVNSKENKSHKIFGPGEVKSITHFANQGAGIESIKRIVVKDSKLPYAQSISTWFSIDTVDGVLFLFKKGEYVYTYTFPDIKDLELISAGSFFQRSERKYSIVVSLKEKNGKSVTYIVDSDSGSVKLVDNKFRYLSESESSGSFRQTFSYNEEKQEIDFGHGDRVRLSQLEVKSKLKVEEYSFSKESQVNQFRNEVLGSGQLSIKQVDGPELSIPKPRELTTEESINIHGKVSFPIEITHNNNSFKITLEKEGIFVTRQSDKVRVKVSILQQLPSVEGHKAGGFVVEDGILKHPNLLRQVDLGRGKDSYDVFKVEANYVPTEENKEALEWVLESFKDFRKRTSRSMSPISARKLYVDKVLSQMTGPESSSSVLVSESSDRDLILSEVSRRLPRTWKVLTFDPSGFGDLSMSGQKGEKAGKVSTAIKSVPIVLAAPKVTNLAGVGSAQGSSSDVMNLLTPDITDESSGWRLMGTVADSNILRESFKDPDLRNNLSTTTLPDLSLAEVKEHLRQYLGHTLTKFTISEEVLDYLIAKANQARKTESEPGRSQNFLTAIARKIESGAITKEEVNKALSYHFNISTHLISAANQNKTLNNFAPNAKKNLSGHGHLISNFLEGLEIGFAGLHSEKGAMQTLWIEGPPGVGKTEFAKQMAKAMNVPLGYIDMNQYSSASRQSSGDLLAAIAKKLEKNPNSVILLDEVEKADFTVLQGLLMIFSNEYFEYPVDDGTGKKEMRKMDCNGASFVLTSNGIGDMVLRWLMKKIENDPKFDHISSEELNKEFFKEFSRESLIEMLTTAGMLPKIPNGLPSPLIDRVDLMVAFPPNFDGMVGLLKIKLREMKKRAYDSMGVKIKLSSDQLNEEQIIKEMVMEGRASQQSVRTQIREFEKRVQGSIALIRRSEPEQMSRVKFYLIDPKRKQFQRFSNKCLAGYVFN